MPVPRAGASGHFRNRPNLIYQHGELVAPRECFVGGDHWILVPSDALRSVFCQNASSPDRVVVTGLCIEPGLVAAAKSAYAARRQRLAECTETTGAFFSSGAEPHGHVCTLVAAAASAVREGHRAVLMASRGGDYARAARRHFGAMDLPLVETGSPEALPESVPQAMLCVYDSREALNRFTITLFPQFDYFLSPSHERVNWALGLGLPMFVVDPPIGTFSPLNRELVLQEKVAAAIAGPKQAEEFGGTLSAGVNSGELAARASRGWGRHNINGFANCARFLIKNVTDYCTRRSPPL